jgi:hypothetical protein
LLFLRDRPKTVVFNNWRFVVLHHQEVCWVDASVVAVQAHGGKSMMGVTPSLPRSPLTFHETSESLLLGAFNPCSRRFTCHFTTMVTFFLGSESLRQANCWQLMDVLLLSFSFGAEFSLFIPADTQLTARTIGCVHAMLTAVASWWRRGSSGRKDSTPAANIAQHPL